MKWTCPKCSEIHETQFDSCWKCGTSSDGTATDCVSGFENCLTSDAAEISMICATTPNLPGRTIACTMGIVCGEAIMGANVFRDIAASITDVLGGRSGAYEKNLKQGRAIALQDMMTEARELGADAIVGVDIDYETVGNSMLMVSVSGTAVKLEPQST
jgi:uncharacterized protein YbjQ (UPF0145 family)